MGHWWNSLAPFGAPDLAKLLDAQFFAALAAFAALVTALINYGQGRIAARANTAQLYIEFSRRYNAPEIAQALMDLADWQKRYGEDFAAEFQRQFEARNPRALAINHARRIVNRYFLDVARAYRAGVLNKTFARLAADHPGAAVFRKIVVPMNRALYRDIAVETTPHTLEKLVKGFGEGEIF